MVESDIDLTVIVVSYNTAPLVSQCLSALSASSGSLAVDCVLVDNASRDNSVGVIRSQFPSFRLIENATNVGFGRANNQALPYVTGRYVLLLNTDAFVAVETINRTIAYMDANPRCGILGVRLQGRDGVLQPCCRFFPTPWNTFLLRTGLNRIFTGTQMVDDMAWDHASVRKCDWVVGCYYLVRKELIDQIGLFDPRYFLYFEEVDHCFAAKNAGWDVVFYPNTTVVHIGGESAKSEGAITQGSRQLEALQIESELLYFRKNLGLWAVLASLLFTTLADAIGVAKRLLKWKFPIGLLTAWQHTRLVWSLWRRTRWATQPTR